MSFGASKVAEVSDRPPESYRHVRAAAAFPSRVTSVSSGLTQLEAKFSFPPAPIFAYDIYDTTGHVVDHELVPEGVKVGAVTMD